MRTYDFVRKIGTYGCNSELIVEVTVITDWFGFWSSMERIKAYHSCGRWYNLDTGKVLKDHCIRQHPIDAVLIRQEALIGYARTRENEITRAELIGVLKIYADPHNWTEIGGTSSPRIVFRHYIPGAKDGYFPAKEALENAKPF